MSELNKNFKATPHKLKKLKEQGDVPTSREWNSYLGFLAITIFMFVSASNVFLQTINLCAKLLAQSQTASSEDIIKLSLETLEYGVLYLAPLFLLLVIAIVIANIMQHGMIFSPSLIKPQFKKLHPLFGFKKIFNKKMIFECVKISLKLTAFSILIYFLLKSELGELFELAHQTPSSYVSTILLIIRRIATKLLFATFIFAITDLAFVRYTYAKDKMMSKKEVVDELKQQEGDPLIKQKRKQLRHDWRKSHTYTAQQNQAQPINTIALVAQKHVVVLAYVPTMMKAPKCIFKEELGRAKNKLAKLCEQGIELVEDPITASIYQEVKVGEEIKEKHYKICAKFFNKIMSVNNDA